MFIAFLSHRVYYYALKGRTNKHKSALEGDSARNYREVSPGENRCQNRIACQSDGINDWWHLPALSRIWGDVFVKTKPPIGVGGWGGGWKTFRLSRLNLRQKKTEKTLSFFLMFIILDGHVFFISFVCIFTLRINFEWWKLHHLILLVYEYCIRFSVP